MSQRDLANPHFSTTRWTIVLQTRGHGDDAHQALSTLCERYWYPLYSYARRWGRHAADAEDAVQEFIGVVLERELFKSADPNKGRLRSFLLTAFKRYLRDRHQKLTAVKRGGAAQVVSINTDDAEKRYAREPVADVTPEQIFEKRWALSVLATARQQTQQKYIERNEGLLFQTLAPLLDNPTIAPDYATLAPQIGRAPDATRMAVHRLRKRFGEQLRHAIRDTVESNEAVDEELRYLQSILRGDAR